MTTPVLYNYDLNEDCYRVRLLASCIGLKLNIIAVDEYPGRDHLSVEMLGLNPAGSLPILTDGEMTLSTTGQILAHLAKNHDPDRRFLPERPNVEIGMWYRFLERDLAPAVRARKMALQDDVANAGAARFAAKQALRRMDDHIQQQAMNGQGYFAGPDITLIDLALFPSFALSRDYGIDHDTFPGLRLWARRVRAVNGFITMPGIPDYH